MEMPLKKKKSQALFSALDFAVGDLGNGGK